MLVFRVFVPSPYQCCAPILKPHPPFHRRRYTALDTYSRGIPGRSACQACNVYAPHAFTIGRLLFTLQPLLAAQCLLCCHSRLTSQANVLPNRLLCSGAILDLKRSTGFFTPAHLQTRNTSTSDTLSSQHISPSRCLTPANTPYCISS